MRTNITDQNGIGYLTGNIGTKERIMKKHLTFVRTNYFQPKVLYPIVLSNMRIE